jgi:hypothetical protein
MLLSILNVEQANNAQAPIGNLPVQGMFTGRGPFPRLDSSPIGGMYIRAAVHLASHCIYPSLLERHNIMSNAWQATGRGAARPRDKGEPFRYILEC